MSESTFCRLCVKFCNEYKLLYNSDNQFNDIYEITAKYFDSTILNPRNGHSITAICIPCWEHINTFHTFQQSVINAQNLLECEKPILHKEQLDMLQNDTGQIEELIKPTHVAGFQITEISSERSSIKYTAICGQEKKITAERKSKEIDNFISKWRSTLECTICRASFRRYTFLKLHFQDKHPGQECHVFCCDRMITKRYLLTQHIRKYHKNSNDDFIAQWMPILECSVCQGSFENYRFLKAHFDDKHPDEECHVFCCNRKITKRYLLSQHIRKYHKNSNDDFIAQWMPLLQCSLCQSSFENYRLLKAHFDDKHPDQECHVYCCDMKLTKRYILMQHIRKFHKKDRMQCKYLKHKNDDFIAQWMPALECPICQLSFANYSYLKVHFDDTHSDQECHVYCCNLKLTKRCFLVKHIRTYHNKDSIQCEICKMGFFSKHSLQTHFGIKHKDLVSKSIYRCTLCKIDYNIPSRYKYHMENVHPNDDISEELATYVSAIQNNCFEVNSENESQIENRHQDGVLYEVDASHDNNKLNLESNLGTSNIKPYNNNEHILYNENNKSHENGTTSVSVKEDISVNDIDIKEEILPYYSNEINFDNIKSETAHNSCDNAGDKFMGISDTHNKPTTSQYNKNKKLYTSRSIKVIENDALIAKWIGTLECVVCLAPFASCTSLQEHFKMKHPKRKFHIICCNCKLNDRSKIVAHLRKVHKEVDNNETLNSCTTDEIIDDYIDQTMHSTGPISRLRKSIENDAIMAVWVGELECGICLEKAKDFPNLKKHFHIKHPGEKCHTYCCGLKLKYRWQIASHIRKCHKRINENQYQCDKCLASFSTVESLKIHIGVVHKQINENSFKCTLCGSLFAKELQLCRHMRNLHKDHPLPEWYCKICNRMFRRQYSLEKHEKNCRSSYKFCLHCNKGFKLQIYLDKHIQQSHPTFSSDENIQQERLNILKIEQVEDCVLMQEELNTSNSQQDCKEV